jgi:ribosome-associated translation inhibitor RaiA
MDLNMKRRQISATLEYLIEARNEMQVAAPGEDDEIIEALDAVIATVEERLKKLNARVLTSPVT